MTQQCLLQSSRTTTTPTTSPMRWFFTSTPPPPNPNINDPSSPSSSSSSSPSPPPSPPHDTTSIPTPDPLHDDNQDLEEKNKKKAQKSIPVYAQKQIANVVHQVATAHSTHVLKHLTALHKQSHQHLDMLTQQHVLNVEKANLKLDQIQFQLTTALATSPEAHKAPITPTNQPTSLVPPTGQQDHYNAEVNEKNFQQLFSRLQHMEQQLRITERETNQRFDRLEVILGSIHAHLKKQNIDV